jgi:hypothetical protein
MEASNSIAQDHSMKEDEEPSEDLLEDFDVLESEKDFLLSLLRTAPSEEVEALKKITNLHSAQLVDFYVTPALRSTVEEFTHTHPFWSQGKKIRRDWSEDEIAEFKQDVYAHARATGLGQHQAKVEVMRAVAAWRKENGIGGGLVLDECEGGSEAESEIYASSPLLVGKPTAPLDNSGAIPPENSKKRKRESLEGTPQNSSSQAVEVDMVEAKHRRNALKKERRKAARDMKKEEFRRQKAVSGADKQNGDQSLDVRPIADITFTESEFINEPAKKRKTSKVGATTSAYFATPHVTTLSSKQHSQADLHKSGKSSATSKRARKEQRAATESNSTGSATLPLKFKKPMEDVELMVKDVAMRMKHPAIEAAPLDYPANEFEQAQTNLDEAPYSEAQAEEVMGKRRKRKRKRNHNRLPDEEVVDWKSYTETVLAKSTSQDALKFRSEKRAHPNTFIDDLPNSHEDEESGNVPNTCEKDSEDVQKLKRKSNRRRKRHSGGEPAVLDESYKPLPNLHQSKISMNGHDAETQKQQADSERVQQHEHLRYSSKRPRRDRGRISKGMQKQDTQPFDPGNLEESANVEPLTELANTNTKSPKQSRRDRGRGRRESDEQFETDWSVQPSGEQSKFRHS